MLLHDVALEAIAYELPPHCVTSAELEDRIAPTMERLGVPKGRIEALTGIRERRHWDVAVTPSAAGIRAARAAIEQAAIDPQELGCLINASIGRDYIEPATSCFVHGALKLAPTCINYDVSNACLGFVTGIINIGLMIEVGLIRYGMVVSGDNFRKGVDRTVRLLAGPDVDMQTFRDNFASLTLGSSAVAAILCHKDLSRSGHSVNGFVTMAATEHNQLCVAQNHYMRADPSGLLTHGLALAKTAWQKAETELPRWSDSEIGQYAPHQVGSRHCAALVQLLSLTASKMFLNFMTLGNIGSAAVAVSLAQAAETGNVKKGDHVGLIGIGSGLNCSLMSINW